MLNSDEEISPDSEVGSSPTVSVILSTRNSILHCFCIQIASSH